MGGKFSPQSAGVKYAPKARLPGGLFLRLFVTNPARCGTIKGYRTHTERTFPCSCLNWSAHGCSARWRGPTGRFMQSFCCCSGRSAAIRQITAFPAPRPSPAPRIILPRWQSRWRWTPTAREMRTSSPPATPTRWRWAFCCVCAAPAGWRSSPAVMRASRPLPLCRRSPRCWTRWKRY